MTNQVASKKCKNILHCAFTHLLGAPYMSEYLNFCRYMKLCLLVDYWWFLRGFWYCVLQISWKNVFCSLKVLMVMSGDGQISVSLVTATFSIITSTSIIVDFWCRRPTAALPLSSPLPHRRWGHCHAADLSPRFDRPQARRRNRLLQLLHQWWGRM